MVKEGRKERPILAGRVGEGFMKEMGVHIDLKEWKRFGKVDNKEEEMKESLTTQTKKER